MEEQRMAARRESATIQIQRWWRKWKQINNQLVIFINL